MIKAHPWDSCGHLLPSSHADTRPWSTGTCSDPSVGEKTQVMESGPIVGKCLQLLVTPTWGDQQVQLSSIMAGGCKIHQTQGSQELPWDLSAHWFFPEGTGLQELLVPHGHCLMVRIDRATKSAVWPTISTHARYRMQGAPSILWSRGVQDSADLLLFLGGGIWVSVGSTPSIVFKV